MSTLKSAKMDNLLIERFTLLVDKHSGGKHTHFAKLAGIPTSTFQCYMQGRSPHADHLLRIRETYNVNTDWLLSGEGPIYIDRAGKEGESSPADADPEVAALLEGARRVLKSGNPIAFDALERNIRYFDHAVATEQRLEQTESKMENMSRELAEIKSFLSEHRKCETITDEEQLEKKAI